jgi:FAD/FMN-containing dehydrogenase
MITKRVKLTESERAKILRALQRIAGPDHATANPAICYGYSGTSMVLPKAMPDFVVRPRDVNDVQKVLALARRLKLPVTPVASGTQEPSTYPWFGGIVLDTMSLNRILELNLGGGYAVVEIGVSVGQLAAALQKHAMRLAMGSFPPGVSVLGNYLMTAANSHRSSGIMDDVLGLEIVLADGTVLQTGSKAFSSTYPSLGWHYPSNTFPNVKNLFLDAGGTLGIVTRGALRFYQMNEAQALPVSAFESYAQALEYMKRLSRGNLVQHVCAWHWALYTIIDHLGRYGRGAPADILLYDPWTKPDDRPYLLVVPSMSGYREVIAASEQAARRITEEVGGRIYTQECQEKWPGAWKFFADHYRDHQPTNQFMGGFGEGFPLMPMVIADPNRVAELERWGLRFLRKSKLRLALSYYSHSLDQCRSVFLRMTTFVSPESTPKEIEQAAATRSKYLEQAFRRYGAIPVRYDYGHPPGEVLNKTGGHAQLLKAIKRALDPDNLLNPGLSISMYGRL